MDENSSTTEYCTENADSWTGRCKLPLDFAADLAIVDALYDNKQQERGNHDHRPRRIRYGHNANCHPEQG